MLKFCSLLLTLIFCVLTAEPASAFPPRRMSKPGEGQRMTIAGLDVIVWQPVKKPVSVSTETSPAPLVIFSHGFRGVNNQSIFLMKALADSGYLVIAPNHEDALANGIAKKRIRFGRPDSWTEETYKDREQDIKRLTGALHNDSTWSSKIDWTKFALAGHSLGGYTVLGLAGAWPSWKLPSVKAVLALAPYTNPFLRKGTLKEISVPVMYQCGNRDTWINLFVKGKNGAFSKTPSPAEYVELDNANHYAWTNFNRDDHRKDLICHYAIEFLNKYVCADLSAHPEKQLEGVSTLQAK